MKIACASRVLLVGILMSGFAQPSLAGLILTLSETAGDGVIASASGSGIFDNTVLGVTNIMLVDDVGEYTASPFTGFGLATPLNFTLAGSTIRGINIDDDGSGNDDIFWTVAPSLPAALIPYNASGSSLVNGLNFSQLIPGTYSNLTHPTSVALGGFSLNIVAAPDVTVPAPSTFAGLGLGLVSLLTIRRNRQRRGPHTA